LKIETQSLDNHQVKLIVEVDPEPVDRAKRQAARNIAKRMKIPGFRPGKAPYNVIQRYVGDESILQEGLELIINDVYAKAIDEAEIHPYGPGQFDNITNKDPLTLEFIIPLEAEVKLGDYHAIRIPYELEPVTDDEVDKALEQMRQRQAIDEPVERPAEEGDHVYIRLNARRLQPAEGQNPELIPERDHSLLIVAENNANEDNWPFPGFSRYLTGMSAGDEKTFNYVFPDDSDFETLRGVEAEFNLKMQEVKKHTLPQLNDEFAQSAGEYENLEALRKDILVNIERQRQDEYNSEYNEAIITQLIEQSAVEYPNKMLEDEIDEVIRQLEQRLKGQNLDLDTYLKTRQLDLKEFRDDVKPTAETRLKRTVILLKISEEENIEVSQEEVETEARSTLEAMTRFMSPDDLRKISIEDMVVNLIGSIMAEKKVERTLERLREIAKGNDNIADVEEINVAETDQAGNISVSEVEEVPESQDSSPDEKPNAILTEDAVQEDATIPVESASPLEEEMFSEPGEKHEE
jgi:trigger factor